MFNAGAKDGNAGNSGSTKTGGAEYNTGGVVAAFDRSIALCGMVVGIVVSEYCGVESNVVGGVTSVFAGGCAGAFDVFRCAARRCRCVRFCVGGVCEAAGVVRVGYAEKVGESGTLFDCVNALSVPSSDAIPSDAVGGAEVAGAAVVVS